MASKPFVPDRTYIEQMKEFPCMFNLSTQREINLRRIKSLKNKLVEELENEGDEFDEEEKIRNKNVLTWIHFRLDEPNEAISLNDEVVGLTEEQNITALGNRVFLSWHKGDEFVGQECLKKLKRMKSAPNFDMALATAKAEQAYCYNRLGDEHCCREAIRLFKEALQHCPDKALWEYGLGLAYRRMTNPNLNLSSLENDTTIDYTKLAAESLFKVADNRGASKNLRSLAFAQLTSLRHSYRPCNYPQYKYIFRDLDVRQLCDKALADGSTIPAVLNACGKCLKSIDVDRAIELLERSVEIRDVNPIAHFHLGICYIRKADQKRENKYKRFGKTVPTQGKHTALHQSHKKRLQEPKHTEFNQRDSNDSPLNPEDELVKKAIHALRKGVSTSNDCNLSALLQLGQVLKRTGQLSEAVKMFNKVVNSPEAVHSQRLSVISALEGAGLCCLQLSETAPEEQKNVYEEEGKKKLTMAISYAVDLAKTKPDIRGCENDVRTAIRTLSSKSENEERSSATAKQKVNLLMMGRDYEKVLPAIEELLSLDKNEINNLNTIEHRLTAYLELKQYEEALTFLNMLEIKAEITTCDHWTNSTVYDLRINIVLSALYERLGTGIHPQPLFQQLFKMIFGHCSGMDDDEMHSEDVPNSDNDISPKRDVLFLFDEEELTDPDKGKATRFGPRLKHVLSSLYGLDADENLRGNSNITSVQTRMDIQLTLTEMMKYEVVIIVLDDENRSPEFEKMLGKIPDLPAGPTCPQFRVLDICGKNSPDVLSVLKPYKWMKLEDIGQLNLTNPGSRGGAGVDVEDRPVQDVFRGDIDAVMRLFSFIIGAKWSHT